MNINRFSDKIREVLSCSEKINESFSRTHIIINPVAGAFQKKNAFVARLAEIERCMSVHGNSAGAFPPPDIRFTTHVGHAGEIMSELFEEPGNGKHLVITVGGDGTHREALSRLIEADERIRSKFCVFRFPMGSGNDSADVVNPGEACSVLSGNFSFARTGAVRFSPQGMEPLYAFNIGGLGLDAFVVIMKNAFRSLPGNVYRIMVDVATLFYEPLFGVRESHATLMKNDIVTGSLMGNFIMFVVGLSGNRTYGDHIRILPDEDNVCAVRTIGLLRKLEMKKRFLVGTHRDLPEVTLATADSIVFEYNGNLPLQLDGEAVMLKKSNFPMRIDILPPAVDVLHPVIPVMAGSRDVVISD